MARTPDAFDMADADEFPDVDTDNVSCKRCGEQGLYWQRVTSPDGRSERPVLFGAGMRRHVCKPSADDFEVLP